MTLKKPCSVPKHGPQVLKSVNCFVVENEISTNSLGTADPITKENTSDPLDSINSAVSYKMTFEYNLQILCSTEHWVSSENLASVNLTNYL